jgi:hypothetical protein
VPAPHATKAAAAEAGGAKSAATKTAAVPAPHATKAAAAEASGAKSETATTAKAAASHPTATNTAATANTAETGLRFGKATRHKRRG